MRSSLHVFKYIFTPSWLMILLAFSAIALFTSLGFWQIQRAAEKQQALAKYSAMANVSPLLLVAGQQPKQYQPIRARGKYLPQVFLLDNQHQNHQFGYDVLMVLEQADGGLILVDRGWLGALSHARGELPEIEVPVGEIEVMGNAYFPSKKHLLLGEPLEKISENLVIVENQDTVIFSNFLHKLVYPFIIRESESLNSQFVRNWQVVSMPPARHYGYALQWFAMALVTLIIFISLNLKKQK